MIIWIICSIYELWYRIQWNFILKLQLLICDSLMFETYHIWISELNIEFNMDNLTFKYGFKNVSLKLISVDFSVLKHYKYSQYWFFCYQFRKNNICYYWVDYYTRLLLGYYGCLHYFYTYTLHHIYYAQIFYYDKTSLKP